MASSAIKVAVVFRSGAGRDQAAAGYRSVSFQSSLAAAGIDPVVIDVIGNDDPATAHAANGGLACRELDFAGVLHGCAPRLVQTFGAESGLEAIWTAAAHADNPVLHFVQSENLAALPAKGPLARALAGLKLPGFGTGARHVTGVLGSNRAAISRYMDAGAFPGARFSRVIVPPVEWQDVPAAAPVGSPRPVFGVYDPYGTEQTLGFVLQAITSTGHPDLFEVKLAYPAYQVPAIVPRNVSVVPPGDLRDFVNSIDALILPYDADHLAESLVTALRAGRTVIVPDGGLASELIGFGRHGVMFAAGSAYDLALKINIMTRSQDDRPFDFQGGRELTARCASAEVARAFAATYRSLVPSSAGD
jgi:hypothetical protein